MADSSQIDTEMYLRDGAPFATVCKVAMKDGRIGVGIQYSTPNDYQQEVCDAAAKQVAMLHLESQEHQATMRDILNFKVAPSCVIEGKLCTKCRVNPSNHRVGMSQYLCCACYIDEGFPPADWHEECMRLYALKNAPDMEPTMTATRQHHEHVDFDGDVDLQAYLGQKAHE